MIKKSFIQSIADKSAKVNALCEYLGTLRTECVREYQKEKHAQTRSVGTIKRVVRKVRKRAAKVRTFR